MKTQIHRKFKIILTIMLAIIIGTSIAQTRVKGNGKVITEERNTGNFTGIKLTCSADLIISQGSTSVTVKTDENILKFISTKVKDGTLEIGVKKDGFRSATTLEVHISIPNLESIKSLGSGDIDFKGTFKAKDLFIANSGSSDIDGNFDVTNLELKMNGSGDIDLEGIFGTFKVFSSGSGDLEAEGLKLEECYVKCSGSGDIELNGKANNLTVTISGSGDVSAYNLTTVNAIVNSSGSSDVTLNVVEKLQARLSGSGDVTYRGNAKADVTSRGSGEVYKK